MRWCAIEAGLLVSCLLEVLGLSRQPVQQWSWKRLACSGWLPVALTICLLAGCVSTGDLLERSWVGAEVHARTGHGLRPDMCDDAALLPPGVKLDDPLTADVAAILALWNNAAFQELLTEVGLARADVIQAGQLTNPELFLLYPIGPKQLEFTFKIPFEALWLRPKRLAAARWESERVAERLVQGALDLVRDAKAAHSQLVLAADREKVAQEAVVLRGRIAEIAEARLKAGDASPLEVATARIDLLRAREEAKRASFEVTLAEERLRALLGWPGTQAALRAVEEAIPSGPPADADVLVQQALAVRPDVRAAEVGIQAAAERARLARCDFFLFAGLIDANGRGDKGFEAGPGMQVTLPIFNWNQGAIARADASLERADRQLRTVQDRVRLEVQEAHTRWQQAEEDLNAWKTQIRPAVEDAIRRAEKAYREGDASLLLVLETTRQLLDARTREAQLRGDLRQAHADLERAAGRRLDQPAPPAPTPAEVPFP